MRRKTVLASLSVLLLASSASVRCAEKTPRVPCLYQAKETTEDPTPEFTSHPSCAVISKSGAPIIEADHLRAAEYWEDLATFLISSQWYYVKPDGRALQVLAYDNGPDPWAQGLVRTLVGGKIVYVDRSFEVAIQGDFDWGWPFEGGRALVCRGCGPGEGDGEHTSIVGGLWGYIDLTGKEVVPVQLTRDEAWEANARGSEDP